MERVSKAGLSTAMDLNVTEPATSVLRSSHELATNAAFIVRVRSAITKSAIDVASEDAGASNHARRVELAGQVLRSPGRWAEMMAEGVAANGTIVAKAMAGQEIPDDDIAFAASSLWDAYAGSSPSESG